MICKAIPGAMPGVTEKGNHRLSVYTQRSGLYPHAVRSVGEAS